MPVNSLRLAGFSPDIVTMTGRLADSTFPAADKKEGEVQSVKEELDSTAEEFTKLNLKMKKIEDQLELFRYICNMQDKLPGENIVDIRSDKQGASLTVNEQYANRIKEAVSKAQENLKKLQDGQADEGSIRKAKLEYEKANLQNKLLERLTSQLKYLSEGAYFEHRGITEGGKKFRFQAGMVYHYKPEHFEPGNMNSRKVEVDSRVNKITAESGEYNKLRGQFEQFKGEVLGMLERNEFNKDEVTDRLLKLRREADSLGYSIETIVAQMLSGNITDYTVSKFLAAKIYPVLEKKNLIGQS